MDKNEVSAVKEIRTDLWEEMNTSELAMQQELIISKMGLLHSILCLGNNPSARGLYVALETALADINALITARYQSKQK